VIAKPFTITRVKSEIEFVMKATKRRAPAPELV
jgi:hypothetical protein